MTDYNKVFVDTAPLIYFLDDDIHFGQKAKAVFEEVLSNGKSLVSSVITCHEYLVFPYRTHNQEKVDVFFEFTKACDIALIPVSETIAEKAAKIRAEYQNFKAMDSLQLAVAFENDCDVFLTNDKQLKQYRDIRCVTLEEWILNTESI